MICSVKWSKTLDFLFRLDSTVFDLMADEMYFGLFSYINLKYNKIYMARVQVQCLTFSPSDLAVNRSFQKSYKPAKRKLEKKKTMKAVCTSTCIDYCVLSSYTLH